MADEWLAAGRKKRDQGIESLRGFLILCVILGHLPRDLIFAGRETGPAASLWSWVAFVYDFHIPAFLAISCLFVPAFNLRWLGRRALLLMVPYLFWLARPGLFFEPVADLQRLYDAQKALPYGNWAWNHSIYWFLPALLACNVVVAGLLRLTRPWRWGLALVAAGLLRWQLDAVLQWHLAGKVPYSLDVAIYFAPLFLAARELYAWRNRTVQVPWWAWCLVAAGGVALVQIFEPVKTHTPLHWRVDLAQLSVPVTCLGALGCALAVLGLLAASAGRAGVPWLAWVGRRGMAIYLMHYYFLIQAWEALKAQGAWMQNEAALAWAPLVLLSIAVLAPCGISWVALKLSPYARYIGMEA